MPTGEGNKYMTTGGGDEIYDHWGEWKKYMTTGEGMKYMTTGKGKKYITTGEGKTCMTTGAFQIEEQHDFDQWFGKTFCIPNDQQVTLDDLCSVMLTPIAAKTMAKLSLWLSITSFVGSFTRPA